jgi:hypothetical protein
MFGGFITKEGVTAVLRLLSLKKCRSLMGFGSSRRRLSSCGLRAGRRDKGSASDLLSFDLVCAQLVWLVASRCVVHQNITFEPGAAGGERELDLNQWMTLQMSTERRRAGSRSHLGSRSTSEYVCDHHVRRLHHERRSDGGPQTVEFEKVSVAHGVWLITPEVVFMWIACGSEGQGIGIRPVEF